jgi:beta-1,4-N-acetylglucosaminyltransferase
MYVRAKTDISSEVRVRQLEVSSQPDGCSPRCSNRRCRNTDSPIRSRLTCWMRLCPAVQMEKLNAHQCSYLVIPRSREVGQSYVSSVFSTLYSILYSLRVVYTARPELILCNGPGTCLPIIVAAWLYKMWLFRPCRVVFIESFCRVESLSLCGMLLYPLVDRLIVQWPQIADNWQLTEYCGRLM